MNPIRDALSFITNCDKEVIDLYNRKPIAYVNDQLRNVDLFRLSLYIPPRQAEERYQIVEDEYGLFEASRSTGIGFYSRHVTRIYHPWRDL